MTKSLFILLISLSAFSIRLLAQEQPDSFTNLIVREWKLQFYGENGKKQSPSPQQEQDRMIFYKDHKVLSIEMGTKQQGIWQYDTIKKLLTITDNETTEKTTLQVLQLDQQRCVLGYKENPSAPLLEVHLLPVAKQ
jgi:hypothetical protein